MKRIRLSLVGALAATALALPAGGAEAANVTIGSPLIAPFPLFLACNQSFPTCTFSQFALPGANFVSSVEGTIVKWRALGATAGKSYRLRVLNPASATEFTSQQSSAPVTPAGLQLETFPTAIPIKAGQLIGIDMDASASLAENLTSGGRLMVFLPALSDGQTATPFLGSTDAEAGFNAEVQPVPTVTGVAPAAGPRAGGNQVQIKGTDLTGASAVKFGEVAAASFQVESAAQITAVVPPGAKPGPVLVSVTTVAGTARAPGEYRYRSPEEEGPESPHEEAPTGCTVPKLRGKRIAAARKALKRAHCRAGKVRRKRGPKAKRGRVLKQVPRAGKAVPAGAKVDLTVGR